eukprot:1195970-Prorocentrum_minimum.AAC.5
MPTGNTPHARAPLSTNCQANACHQRDCPLRAMASKAEAHPAPQSRCCVHFAGPLRMVQLQWGRRFCFIIYRKRAAPDGSGESVVCVGVEEGKFKHQRGEFRGQGDGFRAAPDGGGEAAVGVGVEEIEHKRRDDEAEHEPTLRALEPSGHDVVQRREVRCVGGRHACTMAPPCSCAKGVLVLSRLPATGSCNRGGADLWPLQRMAMNGSDCCTRATPSSLFGIGSPQDGQLGC